MKTILLFSFVFTFFMGFAQENKINDHLFGTWIVDSYDGTHYHYKKVKSFKEDEGGIQFKPDGTLVKRQNLGWCGTPPITYGNYDGTWVEISDSKIEIQSAYWGGITVAHLDIIELNENTMKVDFIHIRNEVEDEEIIELEPEPVQVEDEAPVYTIVEVLPLYGSAATQEESSKLVMEYFFKRTEGATFHSEGKVYIGFIVNSEGEVEQVEVKRSQSDELAGLAVQWVSEMGPWQPGKQRGRAVNVSMTIPVRFDLND